LYNNYQVALAPAFSLLLMKIRPNVPIAVQAANMLRERLRQDFADGGRLPGEHEIAAELGISRGTVRQALNILEQEGVVLRQQGSGTYANPHALQINTRVDAAYEFTQLIEASGFESAVHTVEVSRTQATPELAARLALEPGAPLLYIRKVFSASGQRAIYVAENVPISLIREPYDDSELTNPIFEFISQRCHARVRYIISGIIPTVVDSELAQLLDISAGSAALCFDEVFYNSRNKPLGQASVYFRDPLIRFHALRRMTHPSEDR
jgi:GntR family transcriptional regulator